MTEAYLVEDADHQARIVADLMRAWVNMPLNGELLVQVATCLDSGEIAIVVSIAGTAYPIAASAIRALGDVARPPEAEPLVQMLITEIEKAEAEVAQLTRH